MNDLGAQHHKVVDDQWFSRIQIAGNEVRKFEIVVRVVLDKIVPFVGATVNGQPERSCKRNRVVSTVRGWTGQRKLGRLMVTHRRSTGGWPTLAGCRCSCWARPRRSGPYTCPPGTDTSPWSWVRLPWPRRSTTERQRGGTRPVATSDGPFRRRTKSAVRFTARVCTSYPDRDRNGFLPTSYATAIIATRWRGYVPAVITRKRVLRTTACDCQVSRVSRVSTTGRPPSPPPPTTFSIKRDFAVSRK